MLADLCAIVLAVATILVAGMAVFYAVVRETQR